jgi:hypothetical protein
MGTANKRSSSDRTKSDPADTADPASPWRTSFSHANAIGFALCDDRLRFQVVNGALAAFNGVPVVSHIGNPLRGRNSAYR